jgi:hypothetical protein
MTRDYQKDLEICEKATPGKWEVRTVYHEDSEYSKFIKSQEIVSMKDDGNVYVLARINWSNPVEANAQLMAISREALPYYIKRCMELEEQVRQMRELLESVCQV